MKHKTLKRIFAVLICVLLCAGMVVPTFAAIDPAQPYWGSVAGGLVVADGSTALALERTEIVLDATELPPDKRYDTEAEYLAYGASVSATYTICNPTAQTVTERMLAQVGGDPWYANLPNGTDAHKYTVEIDGQSVQTQLRYSYTPNIDYYHAPSQLGRRDPATAFLTCFSDTYVSHPILSPDATVYVYAYVTEYDTSQKDDYFNVTGTLVADPTECVVLACDAWHPSNAGENKVRFSFPGFNRENPTIYSIGTDIGEVAWTVDEDGERLGASVTLESKTTMTFYELVMQSYDAQDGASEIDYYNAVVAYIMSAQTEGTAVTYMGDAVELDAYNLQSWNCFDLTLAPGQSVTVTVKAPLHPSEHSYYSPTVYTYAFAMTVADAWSACGKTSVRIMTNHYLYNADSPTPSLKEYEQTDDGYYWEGDADFDYLVISTCEKQKAFDHSIFVLLLYLLVVLVVLFVCVILPVAIPVAIVALIVILIVYKCRKKKRAKQAAQHKAAQEAVQKSESPAAEPAQEVKEEDHEQNDT